MELGLRILAHDVRRFAASTLGIAMAVVIMFVELGFLFGVVDSQVNIARLVRGDLVVVHQALSHLNKWNTFPRVRLDQIAAVEGVAGAIPLYRETVSLFNAETGQARRIVVFAFPPETPPFETGAPRAATDRLKRNGTFLFDRRSRDIYGDLEVGDEVRLDGRPFALVGLADIGPNVLYDGAVVMSEGSWLAINPSEEPMIGVLRLKPGADPDAVRRRIAQATASDVMVMTPTELLDREVSYTVTAAPIGLLFGVGVLAGLVVGAMICYQVLFNEITDHLAQYATLKAMGFSGGFLWRIILGQATLLSLAGFAAGLAAAVVIYGYVEAETALLMRLTWDRGLVLLVLTVVMCLGAAGLAMRRVAAADPAQLY